MRKLWIIVGAITALAACKREEVTASGKRELTMRDKNLVLDADNDARFGQGAMPAPPVDVPPSSSPFVASGLPEGWRQVPGTSMRTLNYTFGTDGEAYLTVLRGGVLENVNRWLDQFGVAAVDASGLAAMEPAVLAGHVGVWVSAEGEYQGAMGRPPQQDWALRGVVTDGPQGLVTLKMLGPVDEVKAEEERLKEFVAGLTLQK